MMRAKIFHAATSHDYHTHYTSISFLFALFFLETATLASFLYKPSSHQRPTFHALSLSFETRERRDNIALFFSSTRFQEKLQSLERVDRKREKKKDNLNRYFKF